MLWVEAKYTWKLMSANQDQANELSRELGLDPIIAQLLVARGYEDVASAQAFLKPSPDGFYDPFLLHDMDQAVKRIQIAAEKGEKVVVYGDYDVDGLTSTAIVYEVLKEMLGMDVSYYIPDRFQDGYGPNLAVYERLIDEGNQLIITVDNGITGSQAVAYAKSRNVDVIVTDHHELPAQLPEAYAVVHPRYPESEYPFGGLSGAGVAFKLASALLDEIPEDFLDLAALGTVADLVELKDENRLLVTFGLQALNLGQRPGLAYLVSEMGKHLGDLTESDIGFGLGPRLNALGRMGNAQEGVEFLTTLDDQRAQELAKKLQALNTKRQEVVDQIEAEALQNLEDSHLVNLVAGPDWNEGVVGIVASRLVEKTGKPSLVLSLKDDIAKGSGRSVTAFNLFEALDGHRDIMEKFGGHHMACGLTIKEENLPKLQEILDQAAQAVNLEQARKPELTLAGILPLASVNFELVDSLKALAPFGVGNEQPYFGLTDYQVQSTRQLSEGKHLKLQLASANPLKPAQMDVMFFKVADQIEAMTSQVDQLEFVGQLEINEWQGRRSLQMLATDWQIATETAISLKEDTNISETGVRVVDGRMASGQDLLEILQAGGNFLIFDTKLLERSRQVVTNDQSFMVGPSEIAQLTEAKEVTFVDCPPDLATLSEVLGQLKCQQINLIFYSKDNLANYQLPQHAEFGMMYKYLLRHGEIYRQSLNQHARALKMSRSRLNFILNVFFDAGFVKIRQDRNSFWIEPSETKKDLIQTNVYQQQLARIKVHQQLLASTSQDLENWVLAQMAK